jgi:5-methylcytosine-specific restriction endonuclease McrA
MTKTRIPKILRKNVWDYYLGEKNKIGKCLCCDTRLAYENFHCGHIIAEKNGGDLSIRNLRPICQHCNLCMHTKNMIDFMKENKLKQPSNFNGYRKRCIIL